MLSRPVLIALLVCGCGPALQKKVVEAYDSEHTSEVELEARLEQEVTNAEVRSLEVELLELLEQRRIDYRLLEGRFHVLSIELRDLQEQCHAVIPP